MKRCGPVLFCCLLLFCGCAHSYVMKMSNGSKVVTASKPKLKNGFYVYDDAKGQQHTVSQARVLEVEPASMAKDDTAKFKGQTSKK